MKKIFGFLLLVSLVAFSTTSCKSKQKVVEITGADISATDTKPATQPVVVVDRGESNERTINKNFHVVVGSFGVQSNAKNLQRTLNGEGNNAIIVINEQGMYRVLIASYDEYSQARTRINQISGRFPDAWVLRQK